MSQSKIHFYALSNFFAAFGGGMILGKGAKIIDAPYLHDGTILAFFLGTVIGLVFLYFIPNHLTRVLSRYLSIGGGITSLLLILIIDITSSATLNGFAAYLFFIFLSIRFAFWFYSRVLRAARVAGKEQKIAWVELGYYCGIIMGLIIWNVFNIHLVIMTALLLDSILQFIAGMLDLYVFQAKEPFKLTENKKVKITNNKIENFAWPLISTLILFTIAIQVVIFDLAHRVPDYFTVYILAIFYFGVSVAAYCYKHFAIYLENLYLISLPKTSLQGKFKIHSSVIIIFAAVLIAITLSKLKQGINYNSIEDKAFICLLIFAASCLYEIFALAVLDRISLQPSNGKTQMIATFGLMGLGAVVALWLLGVTDNSVTYLFVLLTSCTTFAILLNTVPPQVEH